MEKINSLLQQNVYLTVPSHKLQLAFELLEAISCGTKEGGSDFPQKIYTAAGINIVNFRRQEERVEQTKKKKHRDCVFWEKYELIKIYIYSMPMYMKYEFSPCVVRLKFCIQYISKRFNLTFHYYHI